MSRIFDKDELRQLKSSLFRGDSGLSITLGFVAFIGAAHVLIRTGKYGLPPLGDAEIYTHFAGTLAAGEGFEGRLVTWPPLLPVVMAFFRLFGVGPYDAGRIVNIISIGLIVLVVGHWLHHHVRYRPIVIGATVTIIVSYPLARVSSYAMTETLFILITLLALVQIESFLSGRGGGRGNNQYFLLAIGLSALAPLLRWLGVTVIFTGVLMILTSRRFLVRARLKSAAIYGAMSLLPVGLWVTRNWIISETLTGSRRGSATNQTLWDSLSQVGGLIHWYTFVRKGPGWLVVMLWVAGALIMLQAITFLITKRNLITVFRDMWRGKINSSKARPVFPFVAFTVIYFVVLMVAVRYLTSQGIDTRYLSPVYVPLVVATTVWLDRFLFTTYHNSGISAWKSSDGLGVYYNKALGPMAATKWILIGLIISIILANSIRNVTLYIDVIIRHDLLSYLL